MNNSLIILSLALSIFSCSTKSQLSENKMIFSGKITSPNSDSLVILNYIEDTLLIIPVDSLGMFCDTFNIEPGLYKIDDSKEHTKLFLKPGFDLKLTLDTKEFDESIVYSGIGEKCNNFQNQLGLLMGTKEWLNSTYYGNLAKMEEDDFLVLNDSIHQLKIKLLKDYEIGMDSTFLSFNETEIKYQNLFNIESYPNFKRYFENEDFQESETYPKSFVEINPNTSIMVGSDYYIDHLRSYVNFVYKSKYWKEDHSKDYGYEVLLTADTLIKSPQLKEKVVSWIYESSISSSHDVDRYAKQALSMVKSENLSNEIQQKYQQIIRTEKGQPCPNFEFRDTNDSIVTLEDFKGQVVVIDVWATWCLPCVKEFPDYIRFKDKFKNENIKFLSICKMDTKENWLNYIEEKKIKGIQLFAENDQVPFFKELGIYGMPHFLMIDKQGNLFNVNSSRPSHPKFESEILLALAEDAAVN